MTELIEYGDVEFHTNAEIPFLHLCSNASENKDEKCDNEFCKGVNVINENEIFGIIKLKTKKTSINSTPTLFLFTIDTTGSMDENAYKNITKLQVVKQTFRCMINYLSKLETTIYIRVHSFNEDVSVIVDNVLIKQDNVSEIISKINDLHADKSTNIGEALHKANDTMKQYYSEFPNHQIVHIFMTDGQATTGITKDDDLCKIVDTKFTNNFVGFGLDHNALLMKKLSDLDNSEYLFVDNMENTTLIYGETIHRYLYSTIKNSEFVIENGLIYDWKTNTWNNKLIEPIIASETEKIYHIKTSNVKDIEVKLYGIPSNDCTNNLQLLTVMDVIPDLIDMDDDTTIPNDLSKYLFRQKTQELLHHSKNIMQQRYNETHTFKKELKYFFKIMREYMKKNNLLKDKFMNTLCDDICITYRSFDTSFGLMYMTARSTSQGRQQTYNVTPMSRPKNLPNTFDEPCLPPSLLDEDQPLLFKNLSINTPLKLKRNNAKYNPIPLPENEEQICEYPVVEEIDSDSDIDNYTMTNDNTSCYANESTLYTMHTMSQQM